MYALPAAPGCIRHRTFGFSLCGVADIVFGRSSSRLGKTWERIVDGGKGRLLISVSLATFWYSLHCCAERKKLLFDMFWQGIGSACGPDGDDILSARYGVE